MSYREKTNRSLKKVLLKRGCCISEVLPKEVLLYISITTHMHDIISIYSSTVLHTELSTNLLKSWMSPRQGGGKLRHIVDVSNEVRKETTRSVPKPI